MPEKLDILAADLKILKDCSMGDWIGPVLPGSERGHYEELVSKGLLVTQYSGRYRRFRISLIGQAIVDEHSSKKEAPTGAQ